MPDAELRIGMVGHGFIARAHTAAWLTVGRTFAPPLRPRLTALAGRRRDAAREAAERLGWESASDDWESLVRRDDVDVIDICAPGDLHPDIAIAALEAGKHVLCEKPLANTLDAARSMETAARHAVERGVRSMVGFNYRFLPAIAFAKAFIADGRIGALRHVRCAYLQDWLIEPTTPMSWKLDPVSAGDGVLADLGAHLIDLAQYLSGMSIAEVSGRMHVFTTARPTADGRPTHVIAPEAASFLAALGDDVVGTFEVSRVAAGHRNSLVLEIAGSEGSVGFDVERPNELLVYDGRLAREEQGERRVLVTEPVHPWIEAWWPPGHVLGWEHAFTHEVLALIEAIADGRDPEPGFDEGLRVQGVIDAVARSSRTGSWVTVATA
jgi:predicted dehydrogenase